MKLFQTYDSPFPTRVRLLLYAKGIEVEVIRPPGFGATSESKAMVPLFNFAGRSRRHWETQAIHDASRKVAEALAYLETFIGSDGYAVGSALTQADGAIAPQLVLATEWIPNLFGTPDPLESLPKLAAYWTSIQADPIAARLIAETRQAIAEQQAAAREQAKQMA